MKKIAINTEAREKILSGCKKISDIVRLTLGPKGRNVLIERHGGEPLITNDGVTIAKEISFDCPFENIGAQVLREASTKTNTNAGDGTTTAIVLAAEIIKKGAHRIALGESPMLIKEGLGLAANFVAQELSKSAKPIATAAERTAIAVNSCGNEIDGAMVAEAIEKVSANGIITIEENKNGKTTLTFVDGLELPCELASPYFCEDTQTLSATFEDAKIFISDQKISSVKEILPILEFVSREKLPLTIIADDFAPEVISALVINKVRAGIRVTALKCGFFADRREAVLNDLAALTGATMISRENDLTPQTATIQHLGNCDKIIMSLETSKFISKAGESLNTRISLIKAQIEKAEDEYNKTRLCERLARLTNGVAVISVGCSSEIEQKEKRLRIEDALNATRAACEEGIVAGGGMALLALNKPLKKYIATLPKNKKAGAEILLDCFSAPLKQICTNAGESPEIIAQKCRANFGFDAHNSRFTDMFVAKIVDPAKVVKSAIVNAASVAGTLLTTEAIIC